MFIYPDSDDSDRTIAFIVSDEHVLLVKIDSCPGVSKKYYIYIFGMKYVNLVICNKSAVFVVGKVHGLLNKLFLLFGVPPSSDLNLFNTW